MASMAFKQQSVYKQILSGLELLPFLYLFHTKQEQYVFNLPLCPKSCRMGVKLVSAACQWADAYHRSPSPREKIYDTDTRARSPSKPCFNSVLEKKSCFAGVTKNMLFRKSLKFVFNEFFNLMKLCSTLMMMFLQICKHPSVWQLMCGCVISSRPKDATLSWRHPFDDEGDGDASYNCTCVL